MENLENNNSLLQEIIHSSLAQYCLAIYPDFELSKHHELIISKLEAVERGEITRLIITLPPQHGKSTIASKLFPAWYFGRNPSKNVIEASYGQEFVKGFGRAVRNFLLHPIHQAVFPACQLSDDSSAAHVFTTSAGGEYFAVGRGGPITGRGANLIIIDDPLKDRKEASSPTIRQELKDWYSDVIYTRQRKDVAIVIINTRWHVDDLTGWLLRDHKEENWEVINLPALAEEDDLIGRNVGEALWPSHYPLEKLTQFRAQLTTSSWLSLYQQRPTLGAGYLFKREWLLEHTYDPVKYPVRHKSMNRVILVDPANSQKKTSDYTYMWVIGASEDGNFYVLDCVRDRFTLVERGDALFALHKKWSQPEIVGYEEYGMQADIMYLEDRMKREHYDFHITKVAGGLAKPDRIERLEPVFREGHIWFPSEILYKTKEGTMEDLVQVFLEEEYTNYVAGGGGVKHDDGLDALSRIFDVAITYPESSDISAFARIFYRNRENKRRSLTPWSA